MVYAKKKYIENLNIEHKAINKSIKRFEKAVNQVDPIIERLDIDDLHYKIIEKYPRLLRNEFKYPNDIIRMLKRASYALIRRLVKEDITYCSLLCCETVNIGAAWEDGLIKISIKYEDHVSSGFVCY